MIRLTKTQKKHKEAVKWLVDYMCNRGAGRSYLLAVCFMEMAIEHQGMWIRVWDNFVDDHQRKFMLDHIIKVIPPEGLQYFEFRKSDFSFRYKI